MVEDFLSTPLERVSAFDGMKLDSAVWNQAHDFHRLQQRLHGRAFHGGGIAYGLDVYSQSPPGRSVLISSGLALDQRGSIIVVPEAQEYTFTSKRKGTLYLVLQIREIPVQKEARAGDEAAPHPRLRQAFRIQESETPGGELDVELARVEIGETTASITEAKNPYSPEINEIDLRFRRYAGTHIRGEIKFGQLFFQGHKRKVHVEGLLHLIDHINDTCPFRADFVGQVSPGDDVAHCTVLYFAGDESFKMNSDEEKLLDDFIKKGGFLIGDGCRRTSKDQFGLAFDNLASRLKRKPVQVTRNHPVVRSHYVFAEPPPGAAQSGLVMIGDGLVYCGSDYGCAWSGGGGGEHLPRETIRSALEFGTNMAVFGYRRWSKYRLTSR